MALTGKLRRPRRGKSETPHPIDVHVGSRVRLRRIMLGMSQGQLGAAIGLTFQQVQKYERAANRIGASRLYRLAQVLDVSPTFFYDDMDPAQSAAIPGGFSEPPAEVFDADPLHKRETIELIEAYFAIANTGLRRRLLDLAKGLAAEGGRPAQEQPSRKRMYVRRQHRT